MALYLNGEMVASAENLVVIAKDDFDELSTSEKNNGSVYFIYDDDDYGAVAARTAANLIGSGTLTSGGTTSTLVGAINDLYTRIGGMKFHYNTSTHELEQTYDPPTQAERVVVPNTDIMTDTELLSYLNTFIGSSSTLTSLGYSSVAEAIADFYNRLDNVSFVYNTNTGMVDIVTS